MTGADPGSSAAADRSLATAQVSLADESVTYPLFPVLTEGCPETSDDDVQYPLAVDYDYDRVDPGLFDGPVRPGLERWAPLLPPLSAPGMGAGGTPTVELPSIADWIGTGAPVYLKDESQNPTWSQKDRLARVEVSAAVRTGAPASSPPPRATTARPWPPTPPARVWRRSC